MSLSISNKLVSTLNSERIGEQVLETSEKLLGNYRAYGLEERTISAVMESISWKLIRNNSVCNEKFDIEVKPLQSRTFYDATIRELEADFKQPMDFKATVGETNDNLSAQGALLYCVSGDLEFSESHKRLSADYLPRFTTAAADAVGKNLDKDFLYLILNKRTGLYGFATLRTLRQVSLNQSNFLQASWAENIGHPVSRTTEEFVAWIKPYLLNFKGYKAKR